MNKSKNNEGNCGRVLVILSGGLDSTTLIYWLKNKGYKVQALTFDYNQRHKIEVESARAVCGKLDIPFNSIYLPFNELFWNSKSSLINEQIQVPEGHYEDESMKATIVPNRNMILLAIAAGWAINEGINKLAYAAHAGDHAIYSDCRPEFGRAMAMALENCNEQPIELLTPFIQMRKEDIVAEGVKISVPFSTTYSCYNGEPLHCGRCGTCMERKEAFQLAGVPDPTQYKE